MPVERGSSTVILSGRGHCHSPRRMRLPQPWVWYTGPSRRTWEVSVLGCAPRIWRRASIRTKQGLPPGVPLIPGNCPESYSLRCVKTSSSLCPLDRDSRKQLEMPCGSFPLGGDFTFSSRRIRLVSQRLRDLIKGPGAFLLPVFLPFIPAGCYSKSNFEYCVFSSEGH